MKWFLLVVGLIAITAGWRCSPQESDYDAEKQISGVEGTVIMESDVISRPDVILANQLVLVFPEKAIMSLLGGKVDPSELRFLRRTISESEEGMEMTLTDSDGHFAFSLVPGDYVLCLADSDGPNPADFPATTRGCGQVTVQPNIMRQINVSGGYGEILLVEP
jgi:hypothetical protein